MITDIEDGQTKVLQAIFGQPYAYTLSTLHLIL